MSFFTRVFTRNSDPPEKRELSISDPNHLPALRGVAGGVPTLSGVTVNETTAMSLSAVYASVELLSETIATLPLRTVRTLSDGTSQRATSFLDDPAGPDGPTTHEFVAGIMVAMLLHGNFFALKIYNGIGELVLLQALPSQCVGIEVKNGRKVYRVLMSDGSSKELTDREILHIPDMSLDGVRGVSRITLARQSLGTAIAGEQSAARLYSNGALMSAVVTPIDQDLSPEEIEVVRDTLDSVVGGVANAGSMAILSRNLNIQQWSVNPADAQFLESRKFSTSEVARWFRVPPHLIGDVERSTSWGTGIAEQVVGFQKFKLQHATSRIEARLSRLLPNDLKAEFDYRQLFAGTPDQEIQMLLQQTGRPFLTVNEARRIQNMAPIDGGDELATTLAPPPAPKEPKL